MFSDVPPGAVPALERVVIWSLFFASSVYGHVALKFAVGDRGQTYRQVLWTAATSFWGWSTIAAWGLSCVLWIMVIARQKLLIAGSVSSLDYVLICASAWVFLGERITAQQIVGVGLISIGIVLVK